MAFGIGVSGAYHNSPRQWIGVSGVWRPILRMWIGVSGAWRPYFALGAAGSITAGSYANSATGFVTYFGYQNIGGSTGSISGATFPNGVNMVRELSNNAANNAVRVSVGGFAAHPGGSWLNQVTCNGVTLLASSASFIWTASLGTGTWTWSGITGFGITNGGSFDFVVVPTNP